jgi:release factor glutamine methyltransferase
LATDPGLMLTDEQGARLSDLAARRLAREPLARLIGEQEFFGLAFQLNPDTLVPRPDTETLVEAVLARVPADRAPTILDIGTGTGAILVALLIHRPTAIGIGTDLAEGAVALARANAARHGITDRARFQVADLAPEDLAPVDILVSNPPYIRTADMPGLDPEVRLHDPRLALDGGPDGLAVYRRIAAEAPRLVVPGGLIALEIGYDQADVVAGLLSGAGLLVEPDPIRDLGGRDRVIVARRRQSGENRTVR